MATIQKGAKINFYKFVQVKETGKASDVSSSINKNTEGVNNIGDTVNGIAKSVKRINDIQVKRLELLQAENKKKFKPQYAKTDNKVAKGFLTKVSEGKAPGFLEGLLKMFSSLFKLFIVLPIMKWMADPKNKQAVETAVKVVTSIVKFMMAIAKFGVTNALDGLYGMLSEDTGWFEKVFRFGQAVLGIGTLVLGMKYLFRPDKLIRDIIGSIRALIRFATGGGGLGMGRGRGRGRGRGFGRGRGRGLLGLGTKVVGGGLALWGASELLFPQPTADGTLEGNQDALNLRPQVQQDPLKGVFGPSDKGFLGVENGKLTLIQTPKGDDQEDASAFNDFINNRGDLDLGSLDPDGEFAKLGDNIRGIDQTLKTILSKNELPDEFKPALQEFENNLLNSDIAKSLKEFSGIFEGLNNSDFLNNRKGWKESGGFAGILSAFGLGGKGGEKQQTVREQGKQGGGFLSGLGNLFGLGGKKEKTPPPKMQKITSKQDVSGRFDMKSGKAYINGKEVSTDEYMRFFNMSPKQKLDTYGGGTSGIENFLFKPKKEEKSGGFFGGLSNLFGGGKKKEEKKSSGFLGNLFGGGSNKKKEKKSSWWNPFSWGKKEYGRQIPKYESGGFVSGPDSGYNVDVGGKTIEAHGTEWIGTKSNQTGYVVPIDNKATRANPHLTQERASEASRMGYGEVPGFFLGGLFGNKNKSAGSKNQKSGGWLSGIGNIFKKKDKKPEKKGGWLSGIGNIFGGGKKEEEKKGGWLSGAKNWFGNTFGGGKKEEKKSNVFGDILDRTKNFFGGKGWSVSLDDGKKQETGNWLSNIIDGAKGMFGMGGGQSAEGEEATGPFAGLQNIFSGAKDWLGDTFGKVTAIIPGMGATTLGDNTQQAQEGIAGWVNKTWSSLTSGGKEDTRANTTDIGQSADLQGGKPPTEEEIRVAAALSTEAGRGSSATDVLQVAANRVQHGGYGGTNLTDVFAAPGQFHGVFSRGSNKFKQIKTIEDAAEWAGTTPDVIQGYIRDTRNKTNRSRSNSFVSGALEFRAAPQYYKQNGLVQGEMSSDGRFYDSRWRGGRGDNQYLVGPQDTMIGAPAPVDLGGINTGGGGSVNSGNQTEASRMFGTSSGGKSAGAQVSALSRSGSGGGEEQSGGGPQNVGTQSRQEKTNLDRMTQKRDAAREKIAKNSRNMIEAAMNQIQQMNLANQQTIQQAYATISQLQQQGRMNQPKFINAGGQATTQSPAMQINSLLNPMKKAS